MQEASTDNNILKEEASDNSVNTTEAHLFYYKVCEEQIGDTDENEHYKEEYSFKTGNLLKRKFDAEDWYNRRTVVISNKKRLYESLNNNTVSFIIKLFLIEYIDDEQVNTYLLKDEYGIDNRENRLFEAITLENSGFDKSSTIGNVIPRDKSDAINSFLNG